MHPSNNNIAAYLGQRTAIFPASSAAATVNGAAIDTQGFNSLAFVGSCGAASGTPSAQSVIYKLQESDDGSTGWGDITGAVAAALTANNSTAKIPLNVQGRKRYIRAVATVSFTAGTSPAIPVSGVILLGGAANLPAV